MAVEDRKTLVKGAKIIYNSRGNVFKKVKRQYDKISDRMKFDKEFITGTIGEFEPYELESQEQKKTLDSFYK